MKNPGESNRVREAHVNVRTAAMSSQEQLSRTNQYLDCNGLVVFETAQAVLRFQGVTVGILRGVEGGRR